MHRRLCHCLCLILFSLIFCVCATDIKAEGRLYYLHSDHLGSTTLVTDENGNVVFQQSYYPYGETRNSTSNLPTERQYTGQISDAGQTDLYYYNARYYDPQIVKFIQTDIVEGPNRYTYVGNNPIKHIDPTGNMMDVGGGGGGSDSNSGSGIYLPVISRTSSNNKSDTNSGIMIGEVYYPQGFAGCSTGPGWATAGNCGPPQYPEVDMAPTYLLGGFMTGLPLATTYGQWMVYDLLLNGGAGYMASELSQSADDMVEVGDDIAGASQITLYKGMESYNGGDVVPKTVYSGSTSYEELAEYWGDYDVLPGKSPEYVKRLLASKHARGFQGFPTLSFTTRYEVAEKFAGESGVVIKTSLPLRELIDIPKISGEIHVNLPLEQILGEQEYVYFGILSKEMFEVIR